MNPRIVQLLRDLYGPKAAAPAIAELAPRLERWRPRGGSGAGTRHPPGLTARDALLITYADQVREPGLAPLRTLTAFARQHLAGVLSGVHLLPFYPSSSDDGFSVKDYFAVDPAFGDWNDVEALGAGFDLMFDGVFNHVSAQGEWFRRFLADDPEYRDFFVTVAGQPDLSQVVRPRALPLLTEFTTAAGPRKVWTTFSADQVDLNFGNPEVLLAVLEALRFYVVKGARFIRLDAIAFLGKQIGTSCLHLPQTHRVIQLLRAVLDEVAPEVLLITETNVPHTENVSYFGDGTNEAQLVYNFALPPLVLHAIASGSADKLTRWAQSLARPSGRVTFLNFLASHDGIGLNPARGILSEAEIDTLVARTQAQGGFVSFKHLPDGASAPYELNINFLDALAVPGGDEPMKVVARKFLTAHALLLSLQGMPALYFHSLFGSRGDRAGAEASGLPRRVNRERLARAPLEAALADPATLRARVFNGLCQWLRLRQEHAAFAPTASQQVLVLDPRVFAVRRESEDGTDRVLCLHSVSPDEVALSVTGRAGVPIRLGPFESRWCLGA